jgi:hypothetical protein
VHLDSLLLFDGLVLFAKPNLSLLKIFHHSFVSFLHSFLKIQSKQFFLEKSLDNNCTFPQSLIFISNAFHSPEGNDFVDSFDPAFTTKERGL